MAFPDGFCATFMHILHFALCRTLTMESVDETEEEGNTALMFAAACSHASTATLLLAANGSIDARSVFPWYRAIHNVCFALHGAPSVAALALLEKVGED